MQTLVGTGSI